MDIVACKDLGSSQLPMYYHAIQQLASLCLRSCHMTCNVIAGSDSLTSEFSLAALFTLLHLCNLCSLQSFQAHCFPVDDGYALFVGQTRKSLHIGSNKCSVLRHLVGFSIALLQLPFCWTISRHAEACCPLASNAPYHNSTHSHPTYTNNQHALVAGRQD